MIKVSKLEPSATMIPPQSKILAIAALMPVAGCRGVQSALDPQGPAAAAIAQSTWIMAAGGAVILGLVMALALYAVYRTPGRRRAPSSNTVIVAGGVVLPVVTLTALLLYGVPLSQALRGDQEQALRIEVIAHRWWWEVRYPGAGANDSIVTANEVRIPVGRPVMVALASEDVIHSFWVPNLAGKIDAIPGRVNRITFEASRAGVFRGQCAEFCGAQHARMAFHVVAEPADAFERWLEHQRQPAARAADEHMRKGEALFIAHCAECHTVRGVAGRRGPLSAPDLTHVASRAWLGAGTLENTPANVAAWIARNDAVKPGNAMPSFRHLGRAEVEALAAWVSTLQ
jgi:cytochrome c oxidase subunit II